MRDNGYSDIALQGYFSMFLFFLFDILEKSVKMSGKYHL